MKVLGLVLSHRKLGNSEALVKEIMNSIPEASQLELIRLTNLKIEPCKACYHCLQPDSVCVIKDDFSWVMDKIKQADALVIGVPVYLLGPHAGYKLLTDRLLGATTYAEQTAGKPCILVSPFGAMGWEGYTRAALLVLPRLLQMKVIDCWQVNATLPGEALLTEANIQYARMLGSRVFTGEAFTPREMECVYCGSDIFRLLPDNQIICPICGAQGVIKGGKPHFAPYADYRFSSQELEEHFNGWVKDMKSRYGKEKENLRGVQRPYLEKNWWIKPNN